MDTFSHILIAFLIFAKLDLRLAFVAGFTAMFVDLDFILLPFSKKYPILEHRGLAHSFPVVISYTLIICVIFWFFTGLNFSFILLAGMTGSLMHITCDSLTNYGTNSLYPLVKKPIKLEMILGVDPLTVALSIPSLLIFGYSYLNSNWSLFNLTYSIASITMLIYFMIHCILKLIVTIRFRTKSLPTFWRVIFKIIDSKTVKLNDKRYKILKWKTYNLIKNISGKEESFKLLLEKVEPPLDSDEKKIAYAYNLKPLRRIFSRVEYLVGKIMGVFSNKTTSLGNLLKFYSLELDNGRFKMGANVLLKENGEFKVKRFYPFVDDILD